MKNVLIRTDGGSRGNPGVASAAFAVWLPKQPENIGVPYFAQGIYLGTKTNNQAEYHAVIESLKWLQKQVEKKTLAHTPAELSVEWQADSMLVVQQMLGHWKIKDMKMQILCDLAHEILSKLSLGNFTFTHIPREQNSVADALVNRCLDEKRSLIADSDMLAGDNELFA